ncbi:hypothetical protein LXL04_028658 [Taraxacum kok-saghyz]
MFERDLKTLKHFQKTSINENFLYTNFFLVKATLFSWHQVKYTSISQEAKCLTSPCSHASCPVLSCHFPSCWGPPVHLHGSQKSKAVITVLQNRKKSRFKLLSTSSWPYLTDQAFTRWLRILLLWKVEYLSDVVPFKLLKLQEIKFASTFNRMMKDHLHSVEGTSESNR